MNERREALWSAVQDTQRKHISAVAAFDAAIVDVAYTTVNGELSVVAQERRVAFENYVKALGDFSRFLKEEHKGRPPISD